MPEDNDKTNAATPGGIDSGRAAHKLKIIMSISVRNLNYIYNPGMPGETVALSDVSFDVADGTILGIIGHTGSGKSTLLQHLNGLIKPTSGEVYIDGECITDGKVKMTDIRRKVGLVFQ